MRHWLVALGVMALASCTPHKVTQNPAPPVAVPPSYSVSTGEAPLPEKWWQDFNDADLDRLVDRALRDNIQLRVAWARLRQAYAIAKQSGSGKYPQVTLDASAARQQSRFDFGDQGVIEATTNRFTVSAGAAYEIDLWKKMANASSAADIDVSAGRDDLESIMISTVAQVAETWFDLVEAHAQKKLLREQLATNRTYLELVELRFKQGLASALDIYQQRQQLVRVRSQLGVIEGTERVLGHSLAVLVGQPPQTLVGGDADTLPQLPPPPGAGLPADLLERRPDVRAARKRIEAADYRVAVAVADRLPNLRLSGSGRFEDNTVTNLIATPLYTLLAGITAPLFDGGRLKAEVERNRAVVEERLWAYGGVLLQAMAEVENALALEARQRQFIKDLEEQIELSEAALREARARYRQGLIDYLPVLTSLQVVQASQVTLLHAQRQLLSFRIQLCRALGGTWTRELAPPKPVHVKSGGAK